MLRLILLLACSVLLTAGDNKQGYDPIDWTGAATGATGQSNGELKHPKTGSSVMRYRIYAPSSLPKKRTLGLVIGFHGLGGDEQAAQGAYWPMRALGIDQEYVFAGGKALGNGWAAADEPALMQFIDWLESVYPIDHRRVFFWGHSNGGWAVGNYSSRHTDRIAGIVRYSGYGVFIPTGKDPANSLLEYYLIHGDSDPTVNVSGSRNYRQGLLAQNFHYVYRELIGGDHGNILQNKEVSADAARWVNALRHKTIQPPAEDMAFLLQLTKDKEPVFNEKLAKPDSWSELVRIGSAYAWTVVAKAAKSKETPLRLAAAQACAKTTFAGDEAVTTLAKLIEDEDEGVRSAAIAALAVFANWHYPAAQTALAKCALRKKGAAAERLAATRALAAVLPLPFLGNFSDEATAFAGIAALLNADLPELREAAFAPLKKAVPDGLGYDPAADESARKRPIAAWQTWFTERAGLAEGKAMAKKK